MFSLFHFLLTPSMNYSLLADNLFFFMVYHKWIVSESYDFFIALQIWIIIIKKNHSIRYQMVTSDDIKMMDSPMIQVFIHLAGMRSISIYFFLLICCLHFVFMVYKLWHISILFYLLICRPQIWLNTIYL